MDKPICAEAHAWCGTSDGAVRAVNGHAASGRAVRVEFDHVAFRYPHGPEVLRDVAFCLEGGQWVSVVGKNGSGKTTLAKLTNGLLRPTGGRIAVCGLDTSCHPVRTLSRVVGYVFQNPLHALYALTIDEEVSFYPRNQGWPPDRIRRSVRATLAALGLAARATDSPFLLSAGEQQRVAMAAVWAGEPQVLILDEPTLGMARADLDTLLTLSARLTAEGRLLITITHDLDLVQQSDRVVVLSHGEVFADGLPHEVLRGDFVDAVFAR